MFRRNLEFLDEKKEEEKHYRCVMIGQASRGSRLLDYTPPGIPPSEVEVTELMAVEEAQPSREAEANRFADWEENDEKEKRFEETPVAFTPAITMTGVWIFWIAGDHDHEMTAVFEDVGVQRFWMREWWEKVGWALPPDYLRR